MDFPHIFANGACWDKNELVSFGGQKVKCQGHTETKCANNYFQRLFPDVFVNKLDFDFFLISDMFLRHIFVTSASSDGDKSDSGFKVPAGEGVQG